MPLGDDQKAMLRLLAREQSYEDIAALMGLSVDEVVTRAQGAVAQLEAEGIPAPTLPEAPGGSAPREVPPASEPQAAPPAPKPEPPAPSPAKPVPEPASARKKGDDRWIPVAAGVVGVLVVVALLLFLILGGSEDGDSTTAAAGDGTSAEVTSPNGEELEPTMAELKPVAGESGSGTAIFGNLEERLILAIEAKGLEPTAKGTRYAVCIAAGPDRILPIASTAVGQKGTIEASVELPAELLLYLLNETYSEIVITRADTARLTAEIKRQPKQPKYTGTPVLRGEITGSLVGNEELLKQVREAAQSEAE